MKKIVVLAALSFALFSCKPEGRVYEKHLDLSPKVEWLKKDSREFKVPIEDKDIAYDLSLSFRYATGYPYEFAKVKVTEISPSGKESIQEFDLKVRDDKGEYIGEAGMDIWDSDHLVQSNKKFEETGTYTYVLEHNMPSDPLNYAMEIGLILDKAK